MSNSMETVRISRFLEKLTKENLYSLEVMDKFGCAKDELEFEQGRTKAIEISRKLTDKATDKGKKRRVNYGMRKVICEELHGQARKVKRGEPFEDGLICGLKMVEHFIGNMKIGADEIP